MAKFLLVKIEPVILKYARKYSGFSVEEVAKKTKLSVDKLQSYEEQKCEIPLTQLEKFSNIYKRPLAFFLLSKIPSDAVEPKNFRIVYKTEVEGEFSPAFYIAIRRARYIQSVISEFEDKKIVYPFKDISINDDTEKLSGWFREYLGVDFQQQKKWRSSADALREWKNIIESKDIFILQHSMPKDDVSAFCLVDKKPYIIILNSFEHENRRIFSLFHEIGHILLRKSGICTPDDLSRNSYEYIKIEKFCNQFAASFLLPREEFLSDQDIIRIGKISFDDWDDYDLINIAHKFKVSREVVLRQFLTVGGINKKMYETKRNEWLKLSKEHKKEKKKNVKIPQYRKCISQNGKAFTSFVLNQYYNNKITFSAASEFLNINPKHVSRLEANLR